MSDLVRVTHGLWRPTEQVADLFGQVLAVLAACPDGTVVSGLTARLHGVWLPELHGHRTEVIVHPERPVPASRPGSRRSEIRARRRVLRADEVVYLRGVPVISQARTWVELGEVLAMPDLVAAGDFVLRADTTIDEMAELVRRASHRRGVVNARAALPLLDGRSRSRPESLLRYALVSAGLPKPAVNEPIYSAGGEWLAEPDLSYDDVRLAIEYNGADHADPKRMRRDITREIDVRHRGGWGVVTFGPVEVFQRTDQAVAVVRQLRRERATLRRLAG
jgi:hypothetical protein